MLLPKTWPRLDFKLARTPSSLHMTSLVLIAFISIHGSICSGVQTRVLFILGDNLAGRSDVSYNNYQARNKCENATRHRIQL